MWWVRAMLKSFKSTKLKYFLITLVIIIVLFALFFLYMKHKIASMHAPRPSLPAVTVTTAKAAIWPARIQATGSLVAQNGITVAPEVAGRVANILFKSGQEVSKGTPLVVLNSDVLQAQLHQYLAELALSQVNFKRDQDLYHKRVKSKSELDQALANLRQDQAMVDKAKAQLAQMTIKAPFSGKLGLRKISLGDYLSPGQAIVNLQAEDPIYVDFSVPSIYLNQFAPGNIVTVTSTSNTQHAITGKVFAIDASIDTDTQTLAVRASIPNPKGQLMPGSFANVRLNLNQQQHVIVLPQLAVQYATSGNSVYRVSKDGNAKQVYIKTGQREKDTIAVLSGLNVGDQIIVTGQQKVRNGSKVKIVPDVATTH